MALPELLRKFLPSPVAGLVDTATGVSNATRVIAPMIKPMLQRAVQGVQPQKQDQGLFDWEAAIKGGGTLEGVREHLKKTGRRPLTPLPGTPESQPTDSFIQQTSAAPQVSASASQPKPKGILSAGIGKILDIDRAILGAGASVLGGVYDIGAGAGKTITSGLRGDQKGIDEGIQQFSSPVISAAKTVPGIVEGVVDRAIVRPVEATASWVGAFPEAMRVLSGNASEADITEIQKSNRKSFNMTTGVADLMPIPAAQFAAGLAENTLDGEGPLETMYDLNTEEGRALRGQKMTEGFVGGGGRAAFTAVLNKIFKSKPKGDVHSGTKTRAKLSGMSEQDVKGVVDMSDDPALAKQYLAQAKKATTDRTVSGPMDLAGKQFAEFQDDIARQSDDVGAKIGEQVKTLKGPDVVKLDSKPIRDEMTKRLRSMNVTVKRNGQLDFRNSDVAGITADQNLISETWHYLQKDWLPMRSTLAKIRNLRNRIYAGSGDLTASKAVVEGARQGMKDSLYSVRGKLGELSKQYARLEEFATEAAKKTSEGVRSPEFLRRSFSNTASAPKALLNQGEELAKEFGIESGKNISKKASLAASAENVASLTAENSVAGQVIRATAPTPGVLSRIWSFLGDQTAGRVIGKADWNYLNILKQAAKQPGMIEQLLGPYAKTQMGHDIVNYLRDERGSQSRPPRILQ